MMRALLLAFCTADDGTRVNGEGGAVPYIEPSVKFINTLGRSKIRTGKVEGIHKAKVRCCWQVPGCDGSGSCTMPARRAADHVCPDGTAKLVAIPDMNAVFQPEVHYSWHLSGYYSRRCKDHSANRQIQNCRHIVLNFCGYA